MGRITEQVEELAYPIIESSGLELVDIEYVKEGEMWFLRVFIDDENGKISINDCERVSKSLSDILDQKDLIDHSYNLEVSTPGLERKLKKESDYERFKGEHVYVKTYAPLNGKKEFEGELMGIEENHVLIKDKKNDINKIPFDRIAAANLSVDFSNIGQ